MPVKLLGISGSVRAGSYNLAALEAARTVLPPDVTLDIADLRELPLYSDESIGGFPAAAQAYRARAAAADAVLIASPEYLYSVSGTLKTALEWASRPPNPPLAGKPCAILGACTGPLGTLRGQSHLRQICVALNLMTLNAPTVDIAEAPKKFDASGALTDAPTRELIRQLVAALVDLTRRLQGTKA
jgi:chromate reductase